MSNNILNIDFQRDKNKNREETLKASLAEMLKEAQKQKEKASAAVKRSREAAIEERLRSQKVFLLSTPQRSIEFMRQKSYQLIGNWYERMAAVPGVL